MNGIFKTLAVLALVGLFGSILQSLSADAAKQRTSCVRDCMTNGWGEKACKVHCGSRP